MCSLSSTPKGCYHFINQTTDEVRRGCMIDISEEFYENCQDTDVCRRCFGDKCNSKQEFTKCIKCDEKNDSNCILNNLLMETTICKQYDSDCYIHIGNDSISRGCLNDMNETFMNDCRGSNNKCDICDPKTNSNLCNSQDLIKDVCTVCDSREKSDCRSRPDFFKSKYCNAFNSNVHGCYLSTFEHRARRGCVEDLPENEKLDCFNQNDTCKSCFGENCNEKVNFHTCISCTSLKDRHCTNDLYGVKQEICHDYMGSCITGIDAEGTTHRRCANETHDSVFVSGKETCSGVDCNTVSVPKNRLQCYQCDDEHCEDVHKPTIKPHKSKPCNRFSLIEGCYTYMDQSMSNFSKNES